MRRPVRTVLAVAVLLGLGIPLAALASGRGGSGTAATTSFTRDVAPVIAAKCAGCHQTGGIAPFALQTPRQISGRASLIAYEYEPYDLYSDPSADLKVAATCKFDSPGEDVGDVGCNPITVEPIRITLR